MVFGSTAGWGSERLLALHHPLHREGTPPRLSGIRLGFYNGLYLPRRQILLLPSCLSHPPPHHPPRFSKEMSFDFSVPPCFHIYRLVGSRKSASAARESWPKREEAPRRWKSDCLHSDRWPLMGKSPFYQLVSSLSALAGVF